MRTPPPRSAPHRVKARGAWALPRDGGPCETGRTMGFLIRVVVNAFAIWVVTLIPALQVTVIAFPPGETLQYVLTLLIVAAIFAVVNTIIGTIIKIISIPLYILTLGLIGLLINGFLLWLTAWITSFWSWGLRVDDFWWGVVAALVITIINWVAGIFLRPKRRD
ncbi:putative membrane protein [Microbacterium sp. BK668]|nr:putative membrane protein [Microbacterium sp. BK668]